MRIYLDDVRTPPPHEGWDVICRTVDAAWDILQHCIVDEISFDHDLGDKAASGYDLACRIEEYAVLGEICSLKWKIHSANPVGRANIQRVMEQVDKVWGGRWRLTINGEVSEHDKEIEAFMYAYEYAKRHWPKELKQPEGVINTLWMFVEHTGQDKYNLEKFFG